MPGDDRQIKQVHAELRVLKRMTETIMVDTGKLLAEVARERGELASWKALSAAKDKMLADTSAALKEATDKIAATGADTAALEKVQADLDKAADDLRNDNDEAEAAIKANSGQGQASGGAPLPANPPPSGATGL